MRNRVSLGAAIGLLCVASAAAQGPDWQAHADVSVIDVITTDADGDVRDVPVWFVEVDGEIYLRTSRSRWLKNLRRDSNLRVRLEGAEYPLRAVEVKGDAIVEAVDAASAEKYGWQESLIHPFRLRTPDILRLESRTLEE
ncbi:MAG: DUF2255 family protein [Deltaproteobacteria bacterium]|nr:DUF2255 family protein [Deltaproteobacteria bacterium]MBW2361627.1 DUF2255 family protein [Deltaproteobacteria bacterium]